MKLSLKNPVAFLLTLITAVGTCIAHPTPEVIGLAVTAILAALSGGAGNSLK